MTVKDIAELAKVSIGTVDRVICHRGRVSAETKSRIEAIIEKYHFTPNPMARRLGRNRAYQFCAFLPRRDLDAGYWRQALEGIQEGAAEIAPFGVETKVVEFDRYSVRGISRAADSMLAVKPDGIILSPIMPETIKKVIEKIRQSGIPCVFFDTDLAGNDSLCSIGQDSFRGGYLAGRLMHLFAGKIVKPLAVLNAYGGGGASHRNGFLHYAGEHGFSTVVREYPDNAGAEIPVAEIALFLKENPNLAGIFITNCMAYRVVDAVKRQKGRRTFVLVGYDLIPKNRELLQEGAIDAVISRHLKEQGRLALLNLYRHVALEQRILPKIQMPLDVYFRENIPIIDEPFSEPG
ncbi:MAG: LacI family DNA-binding transcriptional regulator [Treponema sp.]|nr:LacI family DNA-binding transcriptional regulator [Treponema sp.]